MTEHRPPYAGAAAAAGIVFGLYVLTLAPSTGFWDASEYIATAHIVGIPHPPGNPLFVILARTWTLLLAPFGFPVAVRVNLFAAATSAAAFFFFFLIADRILLPVVEEPWARRVGAFCAVLIGATAYTVWHQSTVNEKVYTVSVMIIAASSWLVIRWGDLKGTRRGMQALLAGFYLMALGSSNHLMSVLPAPAIVVFLLLSGPAVLLMGRFWARAVPLAVVAMSFNLVLPIRAAQRPVINEGDPVCATLPSAVVAVYSQGRAGCPALAAALARDQYQKPPLSQRQAPLKAQLANYLQYFDWQWGRGLFAGETPGGPRTPVTLLFTVLALTGLAVTWRADRTLFAYVATLLGTLTLGLVYYLNFRFGYSLSPEVTDPLMHEVRERDYFFVASFAVWGVLAGIGLTGVWARLSERLGSRGYVLAAPVLVIALFPLAFNARWANRSGDYAARDWAYNLLMSVEPYGVLFTNGDNDTFPLWYLQEVEGIRRDVTVVVVQYLYTDWYPRQLQDLSRPGRQRAYLSEVDGLYGDPGSPPAHSIISTAPNLMDEVRGVTTGQDFTVSLGAVAITYPEGTYLDRAQQLALTIIQDSIGERPIYFASTTGFTDGLGIGDWGIRQGLASKLTPRPPDDPPVSGTVKIDDRYGGEWIDYERTLHLVRDVFSYRGLRGRDVWADRSTLNIPWHFYVLYVQTADAALQSGESAQGDLVQELLADAESFLQTARGGRLGTPGD